MPAAKKTRARQAQLGFEALSIEGGLLSPEWLSRVAQLSAGAQGEADYRIPKGLNLRDEIGRYWRIAQAHWADFAAGRAGKSDSKALTERFVSALLRDSFGFASLVDVAPVVVTDRTYSIGHAALAGRVPVVIASADLGLDAPVPAFGDGGRRRTAFGLAQEYLNAQESAMWGLASDGFTLRILRDNASLTRPAWIEADFQRIFTEERYADFAALWLLVHETRFGRQGQPVTECALETWRNDGREEGTRARAKLRKGVHEALATLGGGFLSHPENQSLRMALQSGALSTKDYFNQLLRLVYRLIFLMTVEERNLLHPEGTTEAAKALYAQGYGLRRLRERAVRRSAHDRFSDLWKATKIVFAGLARGEPRLGLPALAGIFANSQCPALDGANLENRILLDAVFTLAWLREDGALARVNWRDMGPEELGSVYESLLELVPQITKDGREFGFATGDETKGNARKKTGSYYTPDSLVQVLLDSALEPVIADTIARNPQNPIDALLALSIVDPACGSGHFLLAAARRLAAHVARLQANGTPAAAEYRHALRQVVGHCVYGVDLNSMATELCKVSLWMEAVEPGLPLTFLDSHIQHGNALLGTTPELMAKGIPDAAWESIEGDDTRTASALKKRNKVERATPNLSFEFSTVAEGATVAILSHVRALDAAPDLNAAEIERKEATWRELLGSEQFRGRRLAADAWCAAFVWPKQPGDLASNAPTHEVWERLRHAPDSPAPEFIQEVQKLADEYAFFHWHLHFPQVFAKGGFDVVLGNPPWERVKLQEQEFFASRSAEIANASNAAARKKHIATLLEDDPQLWAEWQRAGRRSEGESHLIRRSERYPLCGKGDVNTYAVFAEHNRSVLGPHGRAGFIVPTGIATDDTTKEFFQTLVDESRLRVLNDFQSGPGLFGSIGHGTFKFSLITISGSGDARPAELSFYSRSVSESRSADRVFSLSRGELAILNPNTRTCPAFRSRRDADLTLGIFRRAGVFWNETIADGNRWGLRFLRMIDMTNDSRLFCSMADLQARGYSLVGTRFEKAGDVFLPMLEAKMVFHFDHRFGDYTDHPEGSENLSLPDVPVDRLSDPTYSCLPRYWVPATECELRLSEVATHRRWFLGWRDVSKTQNERTVVAAIIPIAAVANNFPLLFSSAEPAELACVYANLSSFVLDYAARQKLGGTHLNYFVLKQLPILAPTFYAATSAWQRSTAIRDCIHPRVLELTYTAWDLEPFAHDVGYDGPPFRWDPERRFLIRCELDAAFFHLYGLSRDDTDYVMDTFPIVRKNDEKAHGEYRTKRVILEIYDAMANAARTGTPYQSLLDPPPADPRVAHEPRVPEVPAVPIIVPSLPQDQEAAILIWALLRAHGGAIPRGDLARAFALRARPDLLVRLAPGKLNPTVQEWVSKVGQRSAAPGLLAAALRTLSERNGVTLTTDSASRSIVVVAASTPLDDHIDPWFRFEARLALNVLRAQRGRVPDVIDAAITGPDRALLG